MRLSRRDRKRSARHWRKVTALRVRAMMAYPSTYSVAVPAPQPIEPVPDGSNVINLTDYLRKTLTKENNQ